MIKLVYSHDTNIGGIAYDDDFENIMTIDTVIEETGEVEEIRDTVINGNRVEIVAYKKLSEILGFSFVGYSYYATVLNFAKDHDTLVLVDQEDNVRNIKILDITVEKITNTDLQQIEVKFKVTDNEKYYQD
jgi:hypothetical protein